MKTPFLLVVFFCFSQPLVAETLKIASWNIAWLGSEKYNERTIEDYNELSRYGKLLDADIIALQEVENADWAKKVLGDDYDYYFSTRDRVQRVGFAVRKSIGYSVLSSEYKALGVDRVRYGMDLMLTQGDKTLRLLAVHLKSGCFSLPLDEESVSAMPDKSKKEMRRKQACRILAQQIAPLESWIDHRAKEDVPFIVLGDFNRRFAGDIEKSYGEDQGLWQAIDDGGAEQMWSPSLTENSECWGGYYKYYIDHIVFDPRAKSRYVKDSFSQLVFDQEYSRELTQHLSDHCPISIEINL